MKAQGLKLDSRTHKKKQVWQCMPIIPVMRGQRQSLECHWPVIQPSSINELLVQGETLSQKLLSKGGGQLKKYTQPLTLHMHSHRNPYPQEHTHTI